MRLIFCGTPQFAIPTLEKLVTEGFQVELVVTKPDEPSGRGHRRKPPPVKETAEALGLPVFQPVSLKEEFTRRFLTSYQPDAIVVVAYGHMIPAWMRELPRLGCLNLHASLLPKYRGAAPIPWSIIQGERVTGVTIMKIDAGLDTGDILLQRAIPVRDDDVTETLSERLSLLGADLMVEALRGLERGEIAPRPQDPTLATLAPRLKKEDGRIDWSLPAEQIALRVRGLRPWPGAYSDFRGKQLHIWRAVPCPTSRNAAAPGALVAESGKLLAACGGGSTLELQEVQLEGHRRMSARDFLNGVRLTPQDRLQ